MDIYNHFRQLVKKKGTGKTMSKHLSADDIDFVFTHLKSPDIPLAMRATLLTAWIMLDPTPDEARGLRQLNAGLEDHVPNDLHFLFDDTPTHFIDTQIQQLIQHNALTRSALTDCLGMVCQQSIPDYKCAALFESLRLKEETFEENCAVYDVFRQQSQSLHIEIPLLIDMASAYDGFNRHYFLQPFVAALLSSVGIPCLLHGVHEVSPKNGMNTHKILLRANKNPLKSLASVANDLMNPSIGWGYVDQSVYCPPLHDLIPMRLAMVKRPVLATIEKWLQPISATQTICLTGFTHPPYKQKTIDLVHYGGLYSKLILVRGVEGSTLLPHDRRTPWIVSDQQNEPTVDFMAPNALGLTLDHLGEQSPDDSVIAGMNALSGKDHMLANFLCYQCLAIGHAIGRNTTVMKMQLNAAISSGQALAHWETY